jgi:ATP-dependent DNA helicase RecQ
MLWTDKAKKILKKYFNYSDLKDKQYLVINELLHGNDVIGLLPTGYGKSMCYILPPLVTKKTIIIISPLISLMDDQKEKLTALGIKVSALNSNNKNKNEEIELILRSKIRIIYMSPEYLIKELYEDDNFIDKLIKLDILKFLAVDEAHCLSSWGHDFRPNYLNLIKFREKYPNIPILAVTATAKKEVIKDIKEKINLNNPEIICANFDRPNLFLDVVNLTENNKLLNKKNKINKEDLIKQWINTYPDQKIIVYVNSRKDTETLTNKVNKIINNKVKAYHAGLTLNERDEIHNQFTNGEINIIIATIAFGMGIDQIVKCVIIFGCPNSIEEYYQEIGRAGRDGLPAHTILYYDASGYIVAKYMIQKNNPNENKLNNLNKVLEYIKTPICKRQYILQYFGFNKNKNYFAYNNFNCQYCCNCIRYDLIDYTKYIYDYYSNNLNNKNNNIEELIKEFKLQSILNDWWEFINYKQYNLNNIPENMKIKLPQSNIFSIFNVTDVFDKYENIIIS